jgi:LmbE family N-acetylglucosaminyl deacetylase
LEHKLIPYEAVSGIAAVSVLVIAPHPDDEVLGCGGAIRRHVEAGVPVRVVVATDGALGREGAAREDHAILRQAESRAAARVLGYGDPEFWDLPDQSLAYGEELIGRIAAALGDADLIYAPSILEMHPDHRALAMAAVEAVRRAGPGVRLALYEIGIPLRPNLLLDITPVVTHKQAALECFASQLATQQYDKQIAALNRYRTYTLPPQVTAAEAFLLTSGADLAKDPFGIYRPEHERQASLRLPLDARDVPLVSVIVRSQDRPELREALDSLALQTYPNIEVVVVAAGGAHRELPARCGRFSLRLVGGDKPLARSRAANLGLREARGDLLIFLDDDDLFLPDHIARLVSVVKSEAGARAAYAGVRVDGHTGVIDVYDQDFDPARLLAWNHLPISAVLFERGLLDEGCAFDEALDLYEDWDFWLQVSRRTRFARAAGVSAIYRAHLGRSALTQPAGEQVEQARRHIWRKWLPQWPAEGFEALIADFRAEKAEQDARLAAAAFNQTEAAATEKELRRLLEAERLTVDAVEQEFRSSSSWRITAPLRAVLQLLRGRA